MSGVRLLLNAALIAEEGLVTSVLQCQCVYQTFCRHLSTNTALPNVGISIRVCNRQMKDLINILATMADENRRMTANRRQILIALTSIYGVGGVLAGATTTLGGVSRVTCSVRRHIALKWRE